MRSGKGSAALYGGVMLVNAMLLTGVGSLLPPLGAELGIPLARQGLLVSGQYLGYTAAVLSGAVLADRYGKAVVLRLAMLGFVATTVLYWFAGTWAALLCSFVLTGCFGGVLENILTAIAYDEPEGAVRRSTLLQLAFCVGAVGTPLVLYGLGAMSLGWRWLFPLCGAAMAALFCLALRRPASRAGDAMTFAVIGREFLALLRDPRRMLAPLAMLLYVSAEVGLWGFLPTYVSQTTGNQALITATTVLLWVGMAASRLLVLWRWRMSTRGTIRLCAWLLAGAVCAVLLATGAWLLPAAVLAGIAMGPLYAYLVDWMCQASGSGSASMIAVAMAFGTLGPVVTGPITGLLGDALGTKAVMAVPLAACLLILLLLLLDRVGAAHAADGQRAAAKATGTH